MWYKLFFYLYRKTIESDRGINYAYKGKSKKKNRYMLEAIYLFLHYEIIN